MPNLLTLALSDLHLGRTGSRIQEPEELLPLVEGFDRVLLLGDILDHWYLSAYRIEDLEARVRETCHKGGARQVVWFRGNHDAPTADGEEYVLLHGVLYLHGHALYYPLAGKGTLKERIRAMNAKRFGAERRSSRVDKKHWKLIGAAYERLPMRLLNPLAWSWYTRRRIRHLTGEIEEADDQQVRALVFGHSHCPGVRHVGKTMVFNLGGWMKNTRAFGFVKDGATCRLVGIEIERGTPRWSAVKKEISL